MAPDPPFDEAAEPDRLKFFIAELEADGFQRVGTSEWEGPTRRSLVDGGHTDAERMTVIIRPSWPYLSPLLRVPGIAAWHADQELLCIWQADDNSQRWVTLQGMYERIDEWAAHAENGFAIVENARNPEIYWEEPMSRAGGLIDIERLLGKDRADGQHGEFNFSEAISSDGRVSPGVFDLNPGAFTAMTPLPSWMSQHELVRGRWFYRSSVAHPPRSLDEFRQLLTETQRERLERDFRDRPVLMFGLFWPNQAGPVGTVILAIKENDDRRILHLIVLRPKGLDALLLRAGPDAGRLQQCRVAILGVGAIGSHIAEQLVRSGVGKLRLVDYDALWPANLVRHAAPPGTPAGTAKTIALMEHLGQYPWVEIDIPSNETGDGLAWTIGDLRVILKSADLTIDATGHAGLAELAARVAVDVGRAYLSVALFRGGAVARVRRQTDADDTPLVQRPYLDGYPEIPPLEEEAECVGTETGCLARIHNAPPVSVTHAAVLATEVAIDYLASQHNLPDEIIEVIRVGDPPFDSLGRIRREDLPFTVDISEDVQGRAREAAQRALPDETGGILLGCVIDGRPVVADAVEIRDEEATASSYRVPKGRTRQIVASAQARDVRLGYLGEWHSHPSRVGPSTLDVATMLSAAQKSDISNPLLLLIQPNEPAAAQMLAYVTTPAGLKNADVCTTGDLPPLAQDGE